MTQGNVMKRGPGRSVRSIGLAMALPLAPCDGETSGGTPSAQSEPSAAVQKQNLNIRIRIGNRHVPATLRGTATAKDFISLLPLTIRLKDYAGKEKISDLPRKLDRNGAPVGADPSIGDLAYYAPWGNLAIYYRDSPYADGLIILGKIDGDLDALKASAGEKATIELAHP